MFGHFDDEKDMDRLPSLDAQDFKRDDNLDLLYRYIYLDNLHKQRQSDNVYGVEESSESVENLTVIVTHTSTFLGDDKFELSDFLDYYLSLGVSNIIIADSLSNLKFIRHYASSFENFILLECDYSQNTKTGIINRALKKVETDYVLICDDNALISENNFHRCFSSIATYFDFVYPSNRYFKKISSINDFLNDFDFSLLSIGESDFINFDYNFIFCRVDSLKKIGSYNPILKSEKVASDELNIRINHSDFKVKRMDEVIYVLGFIDREVYEDDLNELITQFNLSKLDDLNVLVNQSEEMFYFANEDTMWDSYESDGKYLMSIIIPVYNCEKFYLDRSISSLKNQTIAFENLEVILVDDASTYESSVELVREYGYRYDNIKTYFLEENRGAGVARNFGINHATADYICFLDHDDYYVNSFCEIAYSNMTSSEIDIFIANHVGLLSGSSLTDWSLFDLNNGKKYLNTFEDDYNLFILPPCIWAKCYRRKFLIENDIHFSSYKVSEDNYFNVKGLFNARGIMMMNVASMIYNMRFSENEDFRSISLIINKEMLINRIRGYEEILDLFKQYLPQKAREQLTYRLNYWFKKHLLLADLSKNEFFGVLSECRSLFTNLYSDDSVTIYSEFADIFKAISNGDFEGVYDYYLNHGNFN